MVLASSTKATERLTILLDAWMLWSKGIIIVEGDLKTCIAV